MPKRWGWFLLILGAYLTLRGYHSREIDQAFRLPILLHQQDASVYAGDPFVLAFDQFNPHRGYLALLDLLSKPLGLSLGILTLFLATFFLTCWSVDRLARTVWPESKPAVGLVAVCLFLMARAGNIGTNHLFDGELLDRLVAGSLGWFAFSDLLQRPDRGWVAAVCLGLAALIHPSVGLQLALVFSASWVGWELVVERRAGWFRRLSTHLGLVALALLPAGLLMAGQSRLLLEGLPPDEIWNLSVELQSPQHMVPHLWRLPQWLAWSAYLVIAVLSLLDRHVACPARTRLVTTLGLVLIGLGIATVGIERYHHLRLAMFQPFRMASFVRGLALILAADRVLKLWNRGDFGGKVRAGLLLAGLAGDWMLVVVVFTEFVVEVAERAAQLLTRSLAVSTPSAKIEKRVAATTPAHHLRAWSGLRLVENLTTRASAHRDAPGPDRRSRFWRGVPSDPRTTAVKNGTALPPDRTDRVLGRGSSNLPSDSGSGEDRLMADWWESNSRRSVWIVTGCVFAVGLEFLRRHDTEQGQWALMGAIIGVFAWVLLNRVIRLTWNRRRVVLAFGCCFGVPLSALILPPVLGLESGQPVVEALAERCRFWPVPLDDVEKLGTWARDHTPKSARFIGPPGPKAFRLWSERSLAFNRAGSPYHAVGLADWSKRFKAHVGFNGSNREFVSAYQANRHKLEAGYNQFSEAELADLARSQQADHVLAASNLPVSESLERLKTEGRYAVYRLIDSQRLSQAGASGGDQVR